MQQGNVLGGGGGPWNKAGKGELETQSNYEKDTEGENN